MSGPGPVRAGRVLTVCTGNVCRSPYLERRLRHLLADTDLEVTSAGTRALVGAPVEAPSARLLEAAGGDVSGFLARQLTPAVLEPVDLVITATQQHRAEVVALHPRALRRTFTLGELADLLADTDLDALADAVRSEEPSPASPSWAGRVAEAARDRRGFVRARPAAESDVPDPYRRGDDAYAVMARTIEAALTTVAPALRPRTP